MEGDSPLRTTLFAGHYGSGKTNLAVNYALALAREGKSVTIADLDIVNPFFRTKDSAKALAEAGIRLIASPYAGSNVDTPALPQELYALCEDRSRYAVWDIGGDDRGALALGRYAPSILEERDYEMLFVANFSRPLTQSAEDALEVLREIERAGGIPFTSIVNNTHLGNETTCETVLNSMAEADRLCRMSGLPLRFTSAEKEIAAQLMGKIDPLFPLTLQEKLWK